MAEREEKSAMPRLRRILARNDSPLTGPGTTTFLLGEGEVTVIDPGPEDAGHLAAILAALSPGERIATILVTHPHLDHSALVPRLAAATGAEVLAFGPAGSGRSALMEELTRRGLPEGGEGRDTAFRPDRPLRDGDRLSLPCGEIEVLHTPGHMAEHLCFALGGHLFCGDMVMAWAPSLVSPPDGDMGDYFASMERLLQRDWIRLYPTHGDSIANPRDRINELLAHRRARERQVLEAVTAGASRLEEITARIYSDLTPALQRAASRNVLAHLIDLVHKGRLAAAPWPATEARFTPLSAPAEEG